MKKLTGLLFFLGIFWVPFALGFLLTPLGILLPVYDYKLGDVVASALVAPVALAGFWIWFGWGSYFFRGRLPISSPNLFWSVSIAHHLLWIAVVPIFWMTIGSGAISGSSYAEAFKDWRFSGPGLFYGTWILGNILISSFVVLTQ